MKKTFKYLIFISSFFFSNIALSNNNIYYIDMNFIMNNSLAGKSIVNQLDIKKKSNFESFKKEETDLKNEETKLLSQKNILDKDEFKEKVILFKEKVSKYNKKRNKILNNLKNHKNNAQQALTKKLTPILANYAKDNSISFILSKQDIIIGKTELDLTNAIIEILNKEIKTVKIK
jgi:Skp family chaperone for outer membrane proteins